jgi:hypothetical protein
MERRILDEPRAADVFVALLSGVRDEQVVRTGLGSPWLVLKCW